MVTAHITWAAYPCVIQVFGDTYKSARMAAHFSIYNSSKKNLQYKAA